MRELVKICTGKCEIILTSTTLQLIKGHSRSLHDHIIVTQTYIVPLNAEVASLSYHNLRSLLQEGEVLGHDDRKVTAAKKPRNKFLNKPALPERKDQKGFQPN